MSKHLLVVLLILVLSLTACAQAEPEIPPATATPVEAAQATQPVEVAGLAHCMAEGSAATPNPTAEALLPPITVADWSVGPDDAHVSIIEYGDFQ